MAMKVVYLILAHQNPAHFESLTKTVGENSPVFAHIDAKSDQGPFTSSCARLVGNRVPVFWGGWSIVEATIRLMALAVNEVAPEDHVVLLSGDTYPLQPPESIAAFLAQAGPGVQFVNLLPFPSPATEKPFTRVSRYYREYDPRSTKNNFVPRAINKAKLPRNWRRAFGERQIYCGSQWWTLTGAAFLSLWDEVVEAQTLRRFARHSFVPDEFFFHTLLASLPEVAEVRRNLIFADWYRADGPRPSIIDDLHIDQLREPGGLFMPNRGYLAGPALFGRKFGDDSDEFTSRIRREVWSVPIPTEGFERVVPST